MRARAKTCFENLREDVDVSHSETLRMLNKKLTRFPQSLSFETKGSASRVDQLQFAISHSVVNDVMWMM